VGTGADPLQILRRRLPDPLLDEPLAAGQHLGPGLGVFPTRLEKTAKPAAAVPGVKRLVGPVALPVRFAGDVPPAVEPLGPPPLAADVLRLEVAEHPEAVERILSRAGLVDVAAERDLRGLEPPPRKPFLAHQHVTALVVDPACGVAGELPAQLG